MVAAKTSVILAAIVLGATSTYALPTRFNGDLARRATPEESFLAARQLEGAAAPADSATGVTTAPKPDLIHRIKHAFGHHGGDANKEVPLAARQLEGAAATAGSATDVATPPKPSWFHRVKNALTGHRNDPNKSDQHNQHHHDGHHHHHDGHHHDGHHHDGHHHDGHHHDGHHHDGHHHNGQGQGQHGHEHEHYSTPGAQGQHGLQEPGMSGQQGSGMQGQQGSGMQGQQGSGMQGGSSEYQATSSTGSYKKRSWKRDLADSLGLADEFFLKRAYEDDEFVY